MGRKGTQRVTAQDIARAGSLPALVKQLVKKADTGDGEAKDTAAAQLKALAEQSHRENADLLVHHKGVGPLARLLSAGSAEAQASAAGALAAVAEGKEANQATIVEAGALAPLVKLLKTGSSKVQEQVHQPHRTQGTKATSHALPVHYSP